MVGPRWNRGQQLQSQWLFKLELGNREGTPSLPMAPPLATFHANTIRDPVNTLNTMDLDPSTNTPYWSILTETISYSTPPTADISVEVSQSQDNDTSLGGRLFACESQTPPTDAHLFQPYEGVQVNLSATASHDESTDISTTFIGLVSELPGNLSYQPEHSFPFDTRSCTKASLPNGETFNMLLDIGASRSYLSYGFYLECDYLKKLPTFKPLGPHVYVGNSEWVPVIHIIPIVFHVGNCAFEVYTLVCKMTSSDFIWGMKNVVETEGVICTRSMTYKFLNRLPKLIAKTPVHLPPDGSKHAINLQLDFPKSNN